MEAAGGSESDPGSNNSQGGSSLMTDLTDSECELFRNLKLLEDQEWTESDEDMVLFCGASGSSIEARSSSHTGTSDPMAAYLSEEFKAFLERRGTYKELERVISKVMYKLIRTKKADGTPLFMVKPLKTSQSKTLDSGINVPAKVTEGPAGASTSPTPEDSALLVELLDLSTNENTSGIPGEVSSSILKTQQQGKTSSCNQEDGPPRHPPIECLNKVVSDTRHDVKTGCLSSYLVNKKRLGQTAPRYTGRLPPANSAPRGSDPALTLRGVLQAALTSFNRHTRREIALSRKLGMIVTPLPGPR